MEELDLNNILSPEEVDTLFEKEETQDTPPEPTEDDKKNKETNTGFKGTKRNEIPQMPNVLTPLKPQHKMEDPYPNPKSTTPGKLNFIA